MTEQKFQEFQEAVERWKSGTDSENDRRLIQNVLQTGGVNFGQGNQASVSGSVVGTVINIQFQDTEQAQAFLTQLQGYTPPKKPPYMEDKLPDNFVERPEEYEKLISLLTGASDQNPVALTGIRGAGSL
jgi:hypothetical protein